MANVSYGNGSVDVDFCLICLLDKPLHVYGLDRGAALAASASAAAYAAICLAFAAFAVSFCSGVSGTAAENKNSCVNFSAHSSPQ
jgi:hypothetical protein